MKTKLFHLAIIACILFQSFLSPLRQGWSRDVYAGRIQDNSAGFTRTDFLNNLAGISGGSNYKHYPSAPGTIGSAGGIAEFTTSDAIPQNLSGWNSYVIEYSGNPPSYEIQTCDGTILTSLTAYTGIVDLTDPIFSGHLFSGYPCLQSRVVYDENTLIDNVTYYWTPRPVAVLELVPSNTVLTAGQCKAYQLKRSISYYNSPDTVVYVRLPYLSGDNNLGFDLGTIDPTLNQFPFSNLRATNITNSGIVYTGTVPLVLSNGLEIPPQSIYWLPTNASSGSTRVYQFQLCSDKGTQNGVKFDMEATLLGQSVIPKTTNKVSTTVQSAPLPQVTCTTDRQYVFSTLPSSATVNYSYSFGHSSSSNEDIFDPTAELDMSNVVQGLINNCGLTEPQAISRITLPTGFSSLSVGNATATFIFDPMVIHTVNNYYFSVQDPRRYTWLSSVNYAGCTSTFDTQSVLTVGGANITTQNATCDVHHEFSPPANANVGDTVWLDANNNGIQDNSEEGVSGINVQLQHCSNDPGITNQLIATGMTDANGNYSFSNLPIGNYQVQFSLPVPNTNNYRFINTPNVQNNGISSCFTLSANQTNNSLDAAVIIPNPSGQNLGEGWFNKCMYTSTTDEYKYENGGSGNDTNREGISPFLHGFYDNDCLDNDYDNPVTQVEVNATGQTFYHLNFHGDIYGLPSQSYVKTGVRAVDRIDPAYLIQGVDVWTNTNGRASDNSTLWAKPFCHSSTSTIMPNINTGVLDGSTMPTASGLGVGRTESCDSNSRWVITAMRCVNSTKNPASGSSFCVGSPSRFQFRIVVTPNQPQNLTCGGAKTSISVPNASNVYLQSSLLGTVTQSSEITNTPLTDQLSQSNITSNFYGPVGNPLPIGTTGQIMFLRQNFSAQQVTGNISLQLTAAGGICPEVVSTLPVGFSYNNATCQITGPIPNTPLANSGSTVCDFFQSNIVQCSDSPGNIFDSIESTEGDKILTPWLFQNDFGKVGGGPNCTLNNNEAHTESDLTPWGALEEVRIYNGGSITPQNKTTFDYDPNQRRVSEKQSYRNGSSFVENYKEEYEYTGNNLLQERRIYNWHAATSAYRETKYTFVYNQDELAQEVLVYDYDLSTMQLQLTTKLAYEYDIHGNIIKHTKYSWESSSWVNVDMVVYTYNASNQMISKNQQYRNGSAYEDGTTYMFEYDENGNKVLQYQISPSCSASDKVCNKVEFEYDPNNRLIASYVYGLDYIMSNSLKIQDKTVYGYADSGNMISSTTYSPECVTIPPIVAPQFLEIPFSILYSQGSDGESVPMSALVDTYSLCASFSTSTNAPLLLTTTIPTPPDPIDPPFINPPLSTPHLVTNKYVDTELIGPDGSINYTIQISNIGDAWATNVVLVDTLAHGLEFVSSLTSGGTIPSNTTSGYNTIQSLSGSSYYCPEYNGKKCSVYESGSLTPIPADPYNPYTTGDGFWGNPTLVGNTAVSVAGGNTKPRGYLIDNNFSKMNNLGDGSWASQLGNPNAIAYLIPALFPGQTATFKLTVKNQGNSRGDIILNNVATFADQLLQSISNTVSTTILPYDPNSINGTVYRDVDISTDYLSGTDQLLSGVAVYLYNADTSTLIGFELTDRDGFFAFNDLPDGNYFITYNPLTINTTNNPFLGNQLLSPSSALPGFVIHEQGNTEYIGSEVSKTSITNITLGNGMNQQDNYFGLSVSNSFDLMINKEYIGDSPIMLNATGLYIITVANAGDLAADTIIINDYLGTGMRIDQETIPDDIVNASATNEGNIAYTLSSLPPGETRQIQLIVSFHATGSFLNIADVSVSQRQSCFRCEFSNNIMTNSSKGNSSPDEYIPYDGFAGVDVTTLRTLVNPINGDWSYQGTGIYGSPLYVRGTNNIDATFITVVDQQPIPNYLSGLIYVDSDASLSFTPGEFVFSGVLVSLYSGGLSIGSTYTNIDGLYQFTTLPDGNYSVVYSFESISGYVPLQATPGFIDSLQVGVASGNYSLIDMQLSGGVSSYDNNFILYDNNFILIDQPLNSIAGVVYHDQNKNGTKTTGEGLLSGATVTVSSGSTVLATTTTNGSGAYLFTGLVNGTYSVSYNLATIPGYVPFVVNAGTVEGTPVGATSGLTTVSMITVAGGDDSIENNFGLVQPVGGSTSSIGGTSGGGSSGGGSSGGGNSGGGSSGGGNSGGGSSGGGSSGGGSSGGGTSGGTTTPIPTPNNPPNPVQQKEPVIVLPFKFLQPKEFLPTGIKDLYDGLLKTKGWNTYVNVKNINTSAPEWFNPGVSEENGKTLGYWKGVIPEAMRSAYYRSAEAIVAIPSQGMILPVNYPNKEGITDPNDENAHLKYLDYGVVQRAGSAYLGSDAAGPILIEGHSASLVTNNAGPFGAIMKATVLVNEGESIYAFVKGPDGTYTQYTYRVTKKMQVHPDETGVLTKEKPGTLFISACGDDKQIGSMKLRNLLVAELESKAGVEMDIVVKSSIEYDEEIREAYTWAKEEGVTTQPTIQKARMLAPLTRGELAKMMVEWNRNEEFAKIGKNNEVCTTYSDYDSADTETQQYMLEACSLGLMGRDGKGGTTKEFRWDKKVTRAEFGAVLSRTLRGTKHDTEGELWYGGHLQALQSAGIMKKIDDPMMNEIRGYVMIMLMRKK